MSFFSLLLFFLTGIKSYSQTSYIPHLETSKLFTYCLAKLFASAFSAYLLFGILINLSLIEKAIICTRLLSFSFLFKKKVWSGFTCPLLWEYLRKHMWATLSKWQQGSGTSVQHMLAFTQDNWAIRNEHSMLHPNILLQSTADMTLCLGSFFSDLELR